jgi:F-type H+-transporting ATPase subunit b
MGELFSAFGLDWKLLVIQTVNFGVLLLILWRFLYRPLVKTLDERRGKIAESVQKAEAADRRLAEADAEGKALLAEAGKEAEVLVASGRSHAESQAAEILKKTQEKAEALMSDAEARAEEAKRAALAAGEKEIARAAMLAAEKILKEKHA